MLKQRGISLIEAMVAVAVTSVALVGLSSLQIEANKSAIDAGGKSHALFIREGIISRVQFNSEASANYDTTATPLNCNVPAKICSNYHNGGNRVLADPSCTAEEMATYDLWEIRCDMGVSVPGSITTRAQAINFLPNPIVSVTVDGTDMVTTITWDSTTERQDANGNKIYASNSPLATETRRASVSGRFEP
jgi:type IV pilus assembly protein PilV